MPQSLPGWTTTELGSRTEFAGDDDFSDMETLVDPMSPWHDNSSTSGASSSATAVESPSGLVPTRRNQLKVAAGESRVVIMSKKMERLGTPTHFEL